MSYSTSKAHCGPTQQAETHVKHREAEDLREQITQFVRAGGTIEVLGNTPRRDLHDYKKAEKGRKGGKKNKRDGMSLLFAKPHKPVASEEPELQGLDELQAEEELAFGDEDEA